MIGMMATTTKLKIGTDNLITPMVWMLTSTGLMEKAMATGNSISMTKPGMNQSKTCTMVATCTKMENGGMVKTTMTATDMPNMNSLLVQFHSKLMTPAMLPVPHL